MRKILVVLLLFTFSCNKSVTLLAPSADEDISPVTKTLSASRGNVVLDNFEVGAYLPYWGLSSYRTYNYKVISMLNIITTISWPGVKENKGLIFGDNDEAVNAYQQPDLAAMLQWIREQNPGIKILLALSDLHSNDVKRGQTAALFNDQNRMNTVKWIMSEYVDKYDFDGVDVDFEDSSLNLNFIGMSYPLFVRDMANALHDSVARGRKKVITAALGLDYNRPVITADFLNSIDLLGVMDYGSEKMDYIEANPYRNLKSVAAAWAAKLPKSKIYFGLAGWSIYVNSSGQFAEGFAYSYNEFLKIRPSSLWHTPFLTTDFYVQDGKPTSYKQRYNGVYETRRKAEWTKAEGYRGVFLWDITKDAFDEGYAQYGYLKTVHDWKVNPSAYPPVVGYTTKDFYSANESISVGFHSIPASADNWVGVYELSTGESTGYFQYLPNSSTGNLTIPASLVNQLQSNKLYILRFYNGAGGYGNVLHGTSHPFYRL